MVLSNNLSDGEEMNIPQMEWTDERKEHHDYDSDDDDDLNMTVAQYCRLNEHENESTDQLVQPTTYRQDHFKSEGNTLGNTPALDDIEVEPFEEPTTSASSGPMELKMEWPTNNENRDDRKTIKTVDLQFYINTICHIFSERQGQFGSEGSTATDMSYWQQNPLLITMIHDSDFIAEYNCNEHLKMEHSTSYDSAEEMESAQLEQPTDSDRMDIKVEPLASNEHHENREYMMIVSLLIKLTGTVDFQFCISIILQLNQQTARNKKLMMTTKWIPYIGLVAVKMT